DRLAASDAADLPGVTGDLDRRLGDEGELAEDLERRRVVGIADGAVAGDQRLGRQRAAGRHGLVHAAAAPEVLYGAQPHRMLDAQAHGTNRTRSPRWSSGPSGPNIRIPATEPIRCQPPGESNGYTAECSPAIAIEPAGTRVRGVVRRGSSSV